MKNDSNAKYILIADNSTWMSVHKGSIFVEAAKKFGYKTIRVAPEARLSWQEDVFILDPLTNDQVLIEKLKKYKNKIAYILPGFDFAATLLAPVAEVLEIPFLNASTSKYVGSKSALAKFLDSNKLNTPQTWLIKSSLEFEQIPDDLPLVVKANVSTGSLRKHDWDYRIFENKNELFLYLKESDLAEAFLVNNRLNEGFHSVIQEYIESPCFLDVHVIFGMAGRYETYLVGEFFTHSRELHIVESKSVVQLSKNIQEQIETFVSVFSKNGFVDILANLQFVVRSEKIYLFDLNLRVAGIWSYLHKIMMPDFPHQVLSFFDGKPANFQLRYPFYLKTPFYLEPGRTIEAIQIPTVSDETMLLGYLDHLAPGYSVPLKQNSIQPAPQIFAVGMSEQDCRAKIQNLLKSVDVRYKR